MSITVTLEEAQARLGELIDSLPTGAEVVIVKEFKPVARLVGEIRPPRKRPAPGLCQGMLTIIADDDEHLKDFAEYMP